MEVDEEYLVEVNRKILDKRLAFYKEIMSLGQSYNQVIVGLGYAALLGIWVKMAPLVARDQALIVGSTLALSLSVYVGYHLLAMVVRSLGGIRLAKGLSKPGLLAEDVIAAFEESDLAQMRANRWMLWMWPYVLGSAVLAALIAVALLIAPGFWAVVYSAHG